MVDPTRRNAINGVIAASTMGMAWSGAQAAATPCSPSGTPIREASYVKIGGIDQWLQIRGDDRNNPVLLVLHGGPGSTWDPLTGLFAAWEQAFTMAYWDQRGAGKTYHQTGPAIADTMTIDRMVLDTIEVASYLRDHLGCERVIALGHSWGTVLGVMAVQQRPDLFSAYVGTGQLVNTVQSEREGRLETLRRARSAQRADAIAELEAIGEPPYDDINKMVTERKWAGVFDTPSDAQFNAGWRNPPDFSTDDSVERNKAWLFSNLIMFGQKRQDGPLMRIDFTRSARRFVIPVIFIQGAEDHITPTNLVAQYEREIAAPKKALIVVPGGGHNTITTMPDKFLAALTRALGLKARCGGAHVRA